MRGKLYDAITPDGVLWEIKTDLFSSYPPDLREFVLDRHVRTAVEEHLIAISCGRKFVFGVADDQLYAALRNHPSILQAAIEVRLVPACDRRLGVK